MVRMRNVWAVFMIFSSLLGIAQVPSAKVLAVQGDVKLQKGMDVRTAVPGMVIGKEESIVLSETSYVSFVHKNGETRELRGHGQYPLNSLIDHHSKGVSGAKTMMYADYVLSRMTPEGKKNRLGATGYYIKASMQEEETILMHIPSAGKFYRDNPFVSWEADQSKKYRLEISNMYQEVLQVRESDTNQLQLALDDPSLSDESTLLIKVFSEHGSSDVYALKRMSEGQRETLEEELQAMTGLLDNSSPADKFMLAGIFEYHNLLTDALTCYLQSMQEAPDIVAYREAYEEFLLRNHLIRF